MNYNDPKLRISFPKTVSNNLHLSFPFLRRWRTAFPYHVPRSDRFAILVTMLYSQTMKLSLFVGTIIEPFENNQAPLVEVHECVCPLAKFLVQGLLANVETFLIVYLPLCIVQILQQVLIWWWS